MRQYHNVLAVTLLAAVISSCSSGTEPDPVPTPTPTTAPTAGATATPTTSSTATPAPAATAPPSSDPVCDRVFTVSIKTYAVQQPNGDYRACDVGQCDDPGSGNTILRVDEFVVFDATPKNTAGQKCVSAGVPEWQIDDPSGVFARRGSSNPFLLRTDIARRGVVKLNAVIEGTVSNRLNLEAR